MSSIDSVVLKLANEIETDKITSRKRGYEGLFHVLNKNIELNDPEDVWTKLFSSINMCIQQVCHKLNEDVSVSSSYLQIKEKSSHYLQVVLSLANRGPYYITGKYIVDYTLEALSIPYVLKQGGNIYFVAILKTIPIQNLYADCTPAQWIELYEFCMKHLCNTNLDLDLNTLVKILQFIVSNGCKSSKLAVELSRSLSSVIKAYDLDCIKSGKHLQEEYLRFMVSICKEIAVDFPRTFCDFAKTITPKLLLLYDPSDVGYENKDLIFELFYLFIKYNTWNDEYHTFNDPLHKIVSTEIKTLVSNFMRRKLKNEKVSPNLIKLAVDVSRQVFWKDSTQNENATDERSAKRKCLPHGIYNFQELVYCDNTVNWIWFQVLVEFVNKYPETLYDTNTNSFLEFLLHIKDNCSTAEQVELLYNCIRVLTYLDCFNSKDCTESWFKLFETVCRTICLGEQESIVVSYCNLASCLVVKCSRDSTLFDKCAKSGNDSPSVFNELLKVFSSGKLQKNDECINLLLELLLLLGSSDNMDSNIQASALLKWLLPDPKSNTNQELFKHHFSIRNYSRLCIQIILFDHSESLCIKNNQKQVTNKQITYISSREMNSLITPIHSSTGNENGIQKSLYHEDYFQELNINLQECCVYLIDKLKNSKNLNLIKSCKSVIQLLDILINILHEIMIRFNAPDNFQGMGIASLFKSLFQEFVSGFEKVIKSSMFQENMKEVVSLTQDINNLFREEYDMNVLKFIRCHHYCEKLLEILSVAVILFNKSTSNHDLSDDRMEIFESNDTLLNDKVFYIISSFESLPANQQGLFFSLCAFSRFMYIDSPYFDIAFNELCEYKFDVQTSSADFYIFCEIVKVLSKSVSLAKLCLEWIFSYLQKMCKSHFKNSEASRIILCVLKTLLPTVNRLEQGSTKNNTVIMLSSFIIQCGKNNYGPDVTIELLECFQVLTEVDPASSWSRLQNGTSLYLRIIQFLNSEFFNVRLGVVRCFSKLFDLSSHDRHDFTKYLTLIDEAFKNICTLLEEETKELNTDNGLICSDIRETKILTDVHILSSIVVVNAKYRPRALLTLMELKVINNINADLLAGAVRLIAQHLSIDKKQLFITYMPYILTNWEKDLSEFPRSVMDIRSTKEFFESYENEILAPVLSGNSLESYCGKVGRPKDVVVKKCLVQVVKLLLIYQELKDSRYDYISTVLSEAYDHDGQFLSREIQDRCDEIVCELLSHVLDENDFVNSFKNLGALPELQCPSFTKKQFVNALAMIYKSENTFIVSICEENSSKLQQTLTSSVQKIYKAFSTEEKLLKFHHYSILVDLILEELKTTSNLENMQYFLIRDITHTLINLIINSKDMYKIQEVVMKYLYKFTEIILLKHSEIFAKYLKYTVGTMISLCGTRIESLCLNYLQMLLVDKHSLLRKSIQQLDPLPMEPKFMELRELIEMHNGGTQNYKKTLQEEIEFFINSTDTKDIKVHVELLRNLKNVLSSNKNDLKPILDSLKNIRGFSEDCEHSIVHKLICSLINLISSKDKMICLEASKCLGELGPVDLTTMILNGESHSRNFKQDLLNMVLKECSILLIDPNIQVVCDTINALYEIFKSREGFEWLKSQKKQGAVEDILLYRPFVNSTKAMPASFVPNKNDFVSMVDVTHIWNPSDDCEHKEWLTNLITNILNSFSEDSFLRKLVPICKAKLVFTEKIFPILIKQIVDCRNDSFYEIINKHLKEFFRKHFEQSVTRFNNNESLARFDSFGYSDKSIFTNKASVQCMLNVVECLRLEGKSNLILNYLHVAHAAKCNAAYFTAILYCELWFQSINNSGMGAKCLSRPLDCVMSEVDGRYVQNVLRECYLSLGDTDAVKGCTSNESTSERLKRCGLWNRLTLHYDTQLSLGHSQCMSDLIECLQNTGLFYLSSSLSKQHHEVLSDSHYESLWRLGEWSVNTNMTNDKGNNFNRLHYGCLKSLVTGSDGSQLENLINQSRFEIIESLQNISLECCNKFYKYATRLQMLQEIEDFHKLDAEILINKWMEQDNLNIKVFEYTEPILSQRAVMLKHKSTFNKPLEKVLVNILLDLTQCGIRENRVELSEYNLSILSSMNLSNHAKGQSVLLQAQLSSKEDVKFFLEKILNDGNQINTFNHCTALKMYGDWLAETRSENAEVIVKNYFEKAVALLELLGRAPSYLGLVTSRLEVFKSMAQFADAQYKKIQEYIKSSAYEKKIRCMAKSREMVHSLSNQKRAGVDISQDERMALRLHDQQSKIDKAEIQNTEAEREMYLMWAAKYYMQCLQEGSDRDDLLVFRLSSLWLENTSAFLDLNISALSSRNKKFAELVNHGLKDIPAYKFLPVLPQLAPRLGDEQDNRALTDLIERCAIAHPYHTLPIIMSLVYALQDKEGSSKDDRNQEGRITAARKLVHKLRTRKPLENIISEMETVSLALISFANYVVKPETIKKCSNFKMPRSQAISRLMNLANIPVPTIEVPVAKNGVYNNIISVVRWDDQFSMVGGINAPKKLICRGSDGVPRPQLLKGKDDLRQDAVMQQVFTIMNDLLRRDKDCGARKLLIRTYKVVPLSQRSGVLEWCANTQPLGAFLIGEDRCSGAHLKYRPKDMEPRQAHKKMASVATLPVNVKLQMFTNICENFEPVFQHFFLENFPTPTVWFERRQAYTHSVATTSMVGYILGLGDRHVQNILVDKNTAELIHIDFGIAFEQGRVLPTPETVPFRLTRDIIAGMGVTGIEGVFRSCCEKTMVVLRNNYETILTILEVLLYDPLYAWTVTPRKAYNRQRDRPPEADLTTDSNQVSSAAEVNEMAQRALMRLKQKLLGTEEGVGIGMSSIQGQVGRLIHEATDPSNLCRLFVGWQPYL